MSECGRYWYLDSQLVGWVGRQRYVVFYEWFVGRTNFKVEFGGGWKARNPIHTVKCEERAGRGAANMHITLL